MSTLFLIGNGFDINCGMNTRYTDVYKMYIHEKSNTDVIKNFKEYILADFDTWGDFEIAMGKYAQSLNSETEFLECIRDFANYMEKYLIEENQRVKQLLNDETILLAILKEMRNSFGGFYSDISHNINSTMKQRNATYYAGFNAISFNYTDIFDTLWDIVLAPYAKPVIHIHGVLEDGPVFGVDNISQIKSSFELTKKGKRGFIKPIFNDNFDEQRVTDAKRIINNAMTICVFGMSLGESDLTWRNEIIDWLKTDKEHHLFVYQYNYSKTKFRTITEKLDIEDDAKELLLPTWGINPADEIFDQIHIPCGKNIFNVGDVIKAELHKSDIKKKQELKKKIDKGERFIKENEQKVIIT